MSGDIMDFPDRWEDFIERYNFADKHEIYTNGAKLIPVFRVEQMVGHYFESDEGIVRCGDCRFFGLDDEYGCVCFEWDRNTISNGFCHHGERR